MTYSCTFHLIFSLLLTFPLLAQEKPITIMMCGYNNASYCIASLESVLAQEYTNYHIIYTDDGSTDQSTLLLESYLAGHPLQHKVTLIKNKARMGKLYNVYGAIHECNDNDIVCMVDGDDTLASPDVLSFINKLYKNPEIWLTYGQDQPSSLVTAQKWHISTIGTSRPTPADIIERNAFREYKTIYMHPRTFYAWLFKKIPLDALRAESIPGYEDELYPYCNDLAMMYPMLEMAGTHIYFNDKVLYTYNLENPINGFKVARPLQKLCAQEIRRKKRFAPLKTPSDTPSYLI